MYRTSETNLERQLIANDSEFAAFYNSLHVEDRRFVRQKLARYPREVQRIIIGQYKKQPSLFLANTFLREITDKLNAIIPPVLLLHFDAGEQGLRELAGESADKCRNFEVREVQAKTNSVATTENIYQWCSKFVSKKGLSAPQIGNAKPIEGCIKRMQDRGWWLKKLRKLLAQKTEEVMIHLKQVSRVKGIYCSDITAINRRNQIDRQLAMLKRLSMTNELGENFTLYDIYQVNVSNPTIRRNELMTRMRGFEDTSNELGHLGIFVTLTCPSKYHNAYSKSGQRNPKWEGLTPYDGQQYLCNTWAKVRAEFARQGIRAYGLRVVEPQHDGTPHWHMMLFIEKEHAEGFKSIIERYSFEEDGDEKGAAENRCDFKFIDPKKGSATGYIAKYVSKNIDGKDLDKGIYGEDPIMAAQRVEAWASCWGIRQFQQIGGASVTVWRELRRLRKVVAGDETLSKLTQSADSGDWAMYTKLMGGVFCMRKNQVIRPYYEMVVNKTTGLIKTSWFDGLITSKLKGVLYKGKEIITRVHEWHIGLCSGQAALAAV
mgnify:FL=1